MVKCVPAISFERVSDRSSDRSFDRSSNRSFDCSSYLSKQAPSKQAPSQQAPSSNINSFPISHKYITNHNSSLIHPQNSLRLTAYVVQFTVAMSTQSSPSPTLITTSPSSIPLTPLTSYSPSSSTLTSCGVPTFTLPCPKLPLRFSSSINLHCYTLSTDSNENEIVLLNKEGKEITRRKVPNGVIGCIGTR